MREKMKLIEARDRPKILKLTSLQLIVFCFNCSKSSSFVKVSDKLLLSHTKDSAKNPCSMPK